ncbi:hypothetical protein V4Y02_23575, partial [Escherichia coli]
QPLGSKILSSEPPEWLGLQLSPCQALRQSMVPVPPSPGDANRSHLFLKFTFFSEIYFFFFLFFSFSFLSFLYFCLFAKWRSK